ncbi:MAG: polysaccharide pyruvyl transferase family protein [Pseudomonadota bacterium]
MKVGIFGHYGNANLGDEAITQAAIESVRRHIPGAEIACFSINPADSAARHEVPAYPIRNMTPPLAAHPLDGEPALGTGRLQDVADVPADAPVPSGLVARLKRFPPLRWGVNLARTLLGGLRALPGEIGFLLRSRRIIRDYDLLMITGSNQFLDNFGGVWGFPYTLLKWTLLARTSGCKVALVSLGAGPLDGWWSKRFCRVTLSLSHHASYRDAPSRTLVEGPGPRYKGHVFPDVASNIELPAAATDLHEGDGLLVGINPMPVFDARYWHAADSGKYRAYVEKLAALVAHVDATGNRPLLFSTQVQDNAVIADVVSVLAPDLAQRVQVRQPRQVDDLLAFLQRLDLAIPTRFHGNVLSLRCGTPAIGICYHRKIGDLLTDMGQGEFQVDFADFTVERITSLFDRLSGSLAEAREQISARSTTYREACDTQYEMIASHVTGPRD